MHYPYHSAFPTSAWPSLFPTFCLESFPTVGASLHQGSCDAADLGGDKLLAL